MIDTKNNYIEIENKEMDKNIKNLITEDVHGGALCTITES